jgi:hypothetical protein
MITTTAFRELALSFPETAEGSHQDTADFRVADKIFATLREGDSRAVVKLTAADQGLYMETAAAMVRPVKGSWGKKGWTLVLLDRADPETTRHLLATAWRTVAPKRIVRRHSL